MSAFRRQDVIPAQMRKIFVGGLPHNLDLSTFQSYFIQFGEMEDSVIMADKRTNRPRGFGFVTFKSASSVNAVLTIKN